MIAAIRSSFPEASIVYANGGCYGLFEILSEVYPEAEAYYEPIAGHVYSLISGKFYDINGRAYPTMVIRMRDDESLMKKVHRWKPNYKFTLG